MSTVKPLTDLGAALEIIGRLSIVEMNELEAELDKRREEKLESERRELIERFTAEASAIGLSIEEALGVTGRARRRRHGKKNGTAVSSAVSGEVSS